MYAADLCILLLQYTLLVRLSIFIEIQIVSIVFFLINRTTTFLSCLENV